MNLTCFHGGSTLAIARQAVPECQALLALQGSQGGATAAQAAENSQEPPSSSIPSHRLLARHVRCGKHLIE